jgi:hypothetical protein
MSAPPGVQSETVEVFILSGICSIFQGLSKYVKCVGLTTLILPRSDPIDSFKS